MLGALGKMVVEVYCTICVCAALNNRRRRKIREASNSRVEKGRSADDNQTLGVRVMQCGAVGGTGQCFNYSGGEIQASTGSCEVAKVKVTRPTLILCMTAISRNKAEAWSEMRMSSLATEDQ